MRKIVESMKEDIINFYSMDIEIANRNKETQWIEFGNVFELEKGKLQSSKVIEDEEGDSVFINLSKTKEFKKISNGELNGINLFISNTAPLGLIHYYDGKCSYSDLLYLLKPNKKYKNKILLKYIYYYLKNMSDHIATFYDKGACNKSFDVKNFNRMKIQIPTMEFQNYSMKIITNIEETIKRWEFDIDNILNDGEGKFLTYLEMESIRLEKLKLK